MKPTPVPAPWTRTLESEPQTARERVARLEEQRAFAVTRVARAASTPPDMAALLVERADAVRDALAPFDSGVRAAVTSSQL